MKQWFTIDSLVAVESDHMTHFEKQAKGVPLKKVEKNNDGQLWLVRLQTKHPAIIQGTSCFREAPFVPVQKVGKHLLHINIYGAG